MKPSEALALIREALNDAVAVCGSYRDNTLSPLRQRMASEAHDRSVRALSALDGLPEPLADEDVDAIVGTLNARQARYSSKSEVFQYLDALRRRFLRSVGRA